MSSTASRRSTPPRILSFSGVRGVRCPNMGTPRAELDANTVHAFAFSAALRGALVKVYGSKERALAAAEANSQILNPSYTFPNTVLESKAQVDETGL